MIFVTGGTGLVGSHLLYELVKTENKVRALKRKSSNTGQVLKTFGYYTSTPEELYNLIEWVEGDILDLDSLINVMDSVTDVYHCAAFVSFSPSDRKKMIRNNVEGTANLVNVSIEKGVKRFCHVSSVAALGRNKDNQPVTEETNWIPSKRVSGYSESKFFSENEVWRGIEEGLDAVIVNPSIILGPANWDSGSAKFFKTVWKGLAFYTRGTTGFVDVRDVVQAMILLMDDKNFENCKSQRYILNGANLSYQQFFNQIADSLGKPRPSVYANNFLLGILWRVSELWGLISFGKTMITRDSLAHSNKNFQFDGSKITRMLQMKYRPAGDTIQQVSQFFMKDIKAD